MGSSVFNTKTDSIVVIDIGLSEIKLFDVKLKPEIKLNVFSRVKLPQDNKDQNILKALNNFVKENSIPHRNAILNPYLESFLIKRLRLPVVPEAELISAIKWQLKDDTTVDLASAHIGFSVIDKITKEDGSKEQDLMCVITLEEPLKRQVMLLKQAGFNCLAVSLGPFGYANLLAGYFPQIKDGCEAIIHIADNECYCAIYKDKKLEFYRPLPLSINKLKDSLKGILISEKGRVELDACEIEDILFNIGIPLNDLNYKDKVGANQILSMLRPVLEHFAGELRRSLLYYITEFKGPAISKIFIAGEGLSIPNIDNFLSKQTGLDIQKMPLLSKIVLNPKVSPEILSRNYCDLGLALDFNTAISLLPYEFRTQKIEEVEKVSLRWIAFIVFLLLAVSYIFVNADIISHKKRLENALLERGILSEVKDLKANIDGLNSFFSGLKTATHLSMALKEISNIAAQEILINELFWDCSLKTGNISGVVKSELGNSDNIFNKFVNDMENSFNFSDVSISKLEKSSQGKLDIISFTLSLKL